LKLDICEIFYSLQGESTFIGMPCIFIRLFGCNLNCSYCDTRYAKKEFCTLTFDHIFKKIEAYPCRLVEITGGEPLFQDNTPALISKLLEKDYRVLVETNGSKSIKNLPAGCIKIMDIKCPSSNESHRFLLENIPLLSTHDEIKFVIGSKKDYTFAKSIIKNELAGIPQKNIHLSPVFNCISPETIAKWMLKDHLPARLSLQQHKIIWHPDKRGV